MRAARQQHGEIGFITINRLHYPVALGCLLMLPLMAFYALRRQSLTDIGELTTTCTIAVMAYAFICGALSNPHDRYGARMIWLAVATLALAAVRLYEQRQRLPARDILTATQ